MPGGKSFGWVLALSLAGCVSVQQQSTSPQQAAPVPSSQPRPAAVVGAPSPRIISKTAAAGTSTTLNAATSVNPNCSLIGLPTARVIQAPTHGRVEIVHRDAYPVFAPTDPHSACNTVKVPSTVAEYTPAAGFVGADFLAIEYIFKDGRDAVLRFAISVK